MSQFLQGKYSFVLPELKSSVSNGGGGGGFTSKLFLNLYKRIDGESDI